MASITARTRRLGRVVAMQALYEIDAVGPVGNDPAVTIDALVEEYEASAEVKDFASTLVQGVLQQRAAIDALIAASAPQWPLDQMAGVDKSVLRVAVYELRHGAGAPVKVVINEAIDIAKEYGGEGSGRFVNGVLGAIARSP